MKKQYVYFLKGLPGSGKTHFSKQRIEDDRQKGIITKRINKDDLRAMMDNSVWSKKNEKFVLEARNQLLWLALWEGYDVIIDDTNFAPKHKTKIQELIDNFNYIRRDEERAVDAELKEIFFDTPLQECIERDSKREKPVGRKVIMDMYNRYLPNTDREEIPYNPNLPDCIVVDVDGTLSLHENRRSPFEYWKAGEDRLNKPVVELLKSIQNSREGLTTFIMTGRENLVKEYRYTDGLPHLLSIKNLTEEWLQKNGIHFDEVLIRKNHDHRPDWEVKIEFYETFIKDQYNVLYVIDDRKQVIDMWRSLGLTVLDVAGNEF